MVILGPILHIDDITFADLVQYGAEVYLHHRSLQTQIQTLQELDKFPLIEKFVYFPRQAQPHFENTHFVCVLVQKKHFLLIRTMKQIMSRNECTIETDEVTWHW